MPHDLTNAASGMTPAQGFYGGGPGKGITLPPYYRPTPGVQNGTTFFPQAERLGEDEMRISFAGSCPFPPRREQAGPSILVELGNGRNFIFDFGPGCLRNLLALQIPMQTINDIFLTNLHAETIGELPYLYAFAPWTGRWKPLRVHGPSGRTPREGTTAMIRGMQRMTHWHTKGFSGVPVGDGYEVDVNEFDWADDGGICYQQDGVTIRHWRRVHTMSGATGYRLDWNGLSFVWTGDGRPDETTIAQAKDCDVFVTGMQLDVGRIAEAKAGVPEPLYDMATDFAHTSHYGAGYLISKVGPRIGMVTHIAVDHDLIDEMIAGVRAHWRGLFALGAPDGVVVNVTKDAIWNRTAALPDSAGLRKPTTPAEVRSWLGGSIPATLEIPTPKYRFAELTTEETLSHEISPAVYAPADVQRPLVRDFPSSMAGQKIPVGFLFGSKQVADAVAEMNQALRGLAEGSGLAISGLAGTMIPNAFIASRVTGAVTGAAGAVSQALATSASLQRGLQRGLRKAAGAFQGTSARRRRKRRDGLVLDMVGEAAALKLTRMAAHGRGLADGERRGAPPAHNPYGGGPGAGLTLPSYYRQTPSVKNATTFFPGSEELGKDEMRISFAGSCPAPPKRNQAATCILVELGSGRSFVFDLGPGCLRNLVALQRPIPTINDIFITHLHVDHYGDLPYLYGTAPSMGRYTPLRVHGPSGMTRREGTAEMVEGMKEMTHWHQRAVSSLPVGDGFEVEVNEFDWEDDGGICYDTDGVTIRHWRRIHGMAGAVGYRLDWNGLSFVWTGDGRPDDLTIKYSKGADVFVTELQPDTGALVAIKAGVPEVIYDLTIDVCHTNHYATGYMIDQVKPRIGMVTHMAYDHDTIGEAIAGVRTHWDGLFALGAPDGVVVNVTKDAIWTRAAALPEAANPRPATPAELDATFGRKQRKMPAPAHKVTDLVDTKTLAMAIPFERFVPADVDRPHRREFPRQPNGRAAARATAAPEGATKARRSNGSRPASGASRRARLSGGNHPQ